VFLSQVVRVSGASGALHALFEGSADDPLAEQRRMLHRVVADVPEIREHLRS
jgi:hypothetical protein